MKVYLDHHSSTPVDKRVAEAMEPFFSVRFGNPVAVHVIGEDAKQAVEDAREQVASIIKAKSDNIYFTSSATEANNVILKGRLSNFRRGKRYPTESCIISTNTEHSSVMNCLISMMDEDFYSPKIEVDEDGNLDLNVLDNLLGSFENILLLSIIAANNEIGTIHRLRSIGEICKKHDVLFHTDATQAIGKVDIDVDEMNIFALTMSGHKIYGPKGVGALFVRDIDLVDPLTYGGQQNTLVSGTHNVPCIVGLGKACEILQQEAGECDKIKVLRDDLLAILKEGIPDIIVNGTMKNRLPNNLNVTIKDIQAEVLVKGMEDVIVSGGSACTSGSLDPSHVVMALGTPYPDCAIRISLGRWTTKEEIEYAANRIIEVVNGIRE